MTEPEPLTVRSEFAHVSVALDESGNDSRLVLRDHRGGSVRYVDALELECFTRADTALLDRYLPYERDHPDRPR